MRFSRYFSIIVFIFVFSSAAFAQEYINKKDAVEAAKNINKASYANADTVIIDDCTKVIYQPNGIYEKYNECYEKILTEKAKRDKSSLSFDYNLSYSEIVVSFVEIIKPDGSIVNIDVAKNSKEMTDNAHMAANIYDPNDKVLKVSVPGLEIGDTLHYGFLMKNTKARVRDAWSAYEVFEADVPIRHASYEVSAPDERPLQNIKLKSEIKDTVKYKSSKENGRTVHQWEISNVPRFFEEPNMPPFWTVSQRLLLSTTKDWKELSRWYWDLCKPHLDATTPEMKETVDRLTKGITDKQKKIEALYYYVAQKIRYMGITTETVAPGYEPHDVNITFENKYGVCRDKAALLVAMLRIAGFDAYPVIIDVGQKKDEEVPNVYFNHAIVAVEDPSGSYILMDPTDENTSEIFPAYLCDKSYLVAKPDGETLKTSPIIPAEKNMMLINTVASLNEKGLLKADTTLAFEGVNDSIYRNHFSKMKPDERRIFFEKTIKNFLSGARLTDLAITPNELTDLSQPLVIRLSYDVRNFPVKGDSDFGILPAPWLGSGFGIANYLIAKTGLEKRKYPLVSDIACGIKENFEINIEKFKGEIFSLPSTKLVDNKELTWDMNVKYENNILKGENIFKLKVTEFSPEKYLVLKSVLKEMEKDRRKLTILKNTPANFSKMMIGTDSDIIVLNEEIDIKIADESSWKVISKSKKKVLNYAGKKKYSEIKVNYNPAWSSAKIIKASVRDANGNLKELSEKELNIMDAPWVASAPRYSPGKTLIANLPGVDINSEIEYTVEQTFFNKPFIGISEYFRYIEPLKQKTVKLTVPDKVHVKISPVNYDKVLAAKSKTDEGTVYTWSIKDESSMQIEDALPPNWTYTPCVFISSGNICDYSKQLNDVLIKAASNQKSTEALALKLMENTKSPEDKIIKIRDYVAKNIRSAGPSLDELPFSCISSADTVLADCYGNRQDKAVLLYAMLKATGFQPEFAVASKLPNIKEITGKVTEYLQNVFTEVLVRVKLNNEMIYLNDTDQYSKLGTSQFEGKPMLVLDTKKQSVVKTAQNFLSATELAYDIRLKDDESARIRKTVSFYGMAYNGFNKKFSEMLPENFSRYYQEEIAMVSQSAKPVGELKTELNAYPGEERFTVDVENFFLVTDKKLMYFKLPFNPVQNLFKLSSDSRKYPYFIPVPNRTKIKYTVTVPGKYTTAKILPKSFEWHAPSAGGYIKISSEFTKKDSSHGVIEISYDVNLNPLLISPDDYSSLLKISNKLSHSDNKIVLLSEE